MHSQSSNEPEDAHSDEQNQSADNVIISTRRYVIRLRLQFLSPIVIILSFAVAVIISIVYINQHRLIDSDVVQLQSTANNLYQNSIQQDARALKTVMDVLRIDTELISGLAKLDRKRLLLRATSIYENINRHYGVTHFYFTGPDRVNLLRVHKPEKYGDKINRQTTLTAQHGGADAYGIELGPLGTLTLRYVQPWYEQETRKLLGFVEFGMEVDQTVDSIRDLFGVDIFVLIKKEYLDRRGWEDGMRTFGRVPDWERFPQLVVGMHGGESLSEKLSSRIRDTDFNKHESAFKVEFEQDNEYAIFQPLQDVAGSSVGVMVMIVDASAITKQAQQVVTISSLAVIVAAFILILFFYWFVGRIGKRMARNEYKLEQMATHDGLTGLFNRSQFNLMLEDAIARHTRYDRATSLLMIDVDHFKQVNDTYGHQAGDAVLVELAKRLTNHARTTDRIYRYGGEEFAAILPEINSEGASVFAQRLCYTMSDEQWDLPNGIKIKLTISVGVASCPDHADNAEALIQAADKALYTAKETGRNRVYNFGDIDTGTDELASES